MAKVGRKKKGNEKYLVECRLDTIIKSEVAKRKARGIQATQSEIYEEVAEYVGIATGTVNRIRQGYITPSITISIKIAEFFYTKVEEIWITIPNPDYVDDRERCSVHNCNNLYFGKDLCFKHYTMKKNEEHYHKKKAKK